MLLGGGSYFASISLMLGGQQRLIRQYYFSASIPFSPAASSVYVALDGSACSAQVSIGGLSGGAIGQHHLALGLIQATHRSFPCGRTFICTYPTSRKQIICPEVPGHSNHGGRSLKIGAKA
jgi:hypothetical protein